MDNPRQLRIINVFLFNGVNLLDVSGPVQAFETASINGRKHYTMRYVSIDGQHVQASCGLKLGVDGPLTNNHNTDLLIPGGDGVDALLTNTKLHTLIQQHATNAHATRLISICSGALLLAAAGVLNGRKATTHWSRENDIKQYPDVLWDLDQISTAHQGILTSAGVTTGIDLALAIIQSDCGSTAALAVARELVVQLRRTGGQSQYAMHLAGQFTQNSALAQLIERIVTHPHQDWSLENLGTAAGMHTRTLTRHFKRDLQQTPAQFVEKIRVDHARGLLSDNVPLKQAAIDSGFGDLQRMRRAFQRRFGIHVSDYIHAFGANKP